jgi:hypothetical protein
MQARVGWIQITASEGGLFEYGSDEEIAQNLNQLYANSTDEMRVTGSLIFDRHNVSQGYLGFAELTGIKIRFLGLEGLNALLSKTGWVLEKAVKIDTIFVVFSLRKKGRDKIELKHGKK